jgi:hypothetical protein
MNIIQQEMLKAADPGRGGMRRALTAAVSRLSSE